MGRVRFGTLVGRASGRIAKKQECDYGVSTYQSWNCASGKPSLGCIVTYKMPGVDLDAMMSVAVG